jgi:hypothetical protein
MRPEHDEFDGLRRLLKLKRYEQPPPGYFHDFSQQVIAQIRANAGLERDSLLDRMSWEAPWLQRFLEAFRLKPVLAVSFGTTVCALLVGGVLYSESLEFQPPKLVEVKAPAPATAMFASELATAGGLAGASVLGTNSSLNIGLQPGGSLFDNFSISPEPVKFQLSGSGN